MDVKPRTSVSMTEFDEALDRLADLFDSISADDCIDGDDCDEWRDECPYHRAIDFLASYRSEEWDEYGRRS